MLHRHLVRRGQAAALSVLSLTATAAAQNTAVRFDLNVDGYLEVPFSAQIVPQSGITVEAWCTYDDSLVPMSWRYPTIVRQSLGAQGESIMLRMDADNSAQRELRWRVRTTNGAVLTTNYLFQPGAFLNWTHVAGTYDGATLALYVDGSLVASTPGNGLPIAVVNDVFRIGKGSDVATPIEVWNGDLDEVRLWPFARSEADIQASMDLALSSVPGLVSTWNLDNDYPDSSGGQHATATGQVTFVPGPPLTPSLLPPGLPAGQSTPGCLGDLRLAPSGPAMPGYAGFGVVCTRTPPGAPVVWGASNGVLSSPLPLLGVDVWIDPTGLVVAGGTADVLGAARAPIPVPSTTPVGFGFGIQCVVLDACGPQLFTASNALTIVVQ